jgi:SPP1 family predicted phage head-tail adaptor
MQAGRISLKCLLQQPSGAVDELGQPLPDNWVTVAEVWCEPAYLSGIESIRAGADTSVTKVSVRLRKRAGITNAMRLVSKHDGTVFQINNVLPDARDKAQLFLHCEVVV